MADTRTRIINLPEATTLDPSMNFVEDSADGSGTRRITYDTLKGAINQEGTVNLAPAYSNAATYNVGDYCTYQGKLYSCNTQISTAEDWTAAHWTAVNVSAEISELKNTLDEVTEATRNLNTSAMGRYGNAVDGKIYDRNNTYYGMKDFIPVTEGTAYTIKFWGIPSASWTYLFVNDSGSVISRAGYSNTTAKTVTAPTGATKLNVFCRSDSEIVIDDDTHLQIEVGAATEYIPPISATDYIIREKVEKGFFIYPVIDSTYDLDTLTKLGAYRYNTSSVPQNAPVQKASRLINVPSDANNGTGWIQIAITSDTVMYTRYRITSNWSDWVELASKAYVDARLSELLITDGERWEV